jgi:predicted RNA-binding Zn-ribbon protein involved in translation (DUF1610 family)
MDAPRQCPECGQELVCRHVQACFAWPEGWAWECEECEYREEPQ